MRRLVAGSPRMAPDVAVVGEVSDREGLPRRFLFTQANAEVQVNPVLWKTAGFLFEVVGYGEGELLSVLDSAYFTFRAVAGEVGIEVRRRGRLRACFALVEVEALLERAA